MNFLNHHEAAKRPLEALVAESIAIVAQFEEGGFLGASTVFCHVSVPDHMVEPFRKATGWKKIGTNEFFFNGSEIDAGRLLEKIQLPS